jgi:U3 small nucleolar RNA-associated protein 12
MQPTYLRYECADAFSLSCSSGSIPSAPNSSSILAFLGASAPSSNNSSSNNVVKNCPVLSLAGSQLVGFDLRRGEPLLKIGHRELLSGGLGTGRALNSNHIVCLDVSKCTSTTTSIHQEDDVKVATGWVDGSVRVFSLDSKEMARFTSFNGGGGRDDAERNGLVHSLLGGKSNIMGNSDEFACKEPLVLNGHGSSPVQMVVFDKNIGSVGRLASGGADGAVILWDVIAETGLFRLLGHRGPVTGIAFFRPSVGGGKNESDTIDGLATSGSDGLVKIWDLNGQCCVQTLTGHRGSVGCLDCSILRPPGSESVVGADGEITTGKAKWRLVTGCADGQVRVWSVEDSKYESETTATDKEATDPNNEAVPVASDSNDDNIFRYIGSLLPPASLNITPSSSDGIGSIHFHPSGRYVGVCRANDRVIEFYAARSEVETQKKRRRRLRRRREKQSLASSSAPDQGKTKKRGLLDDPESEDEQDNGEKGSTSFNEVAPEAIKAMDEFEFRGTIRTSHKIRGFAFAPFQERGGGIRVVVALATNALEVYALPKPSKQNPGTPVTGDKVSTLDMYGHPTGIRSVVLSSEDSMACTVSKSVVKIWNVANRNCLRSLLAAPAGSKGASYYCLCAAFLQENTHVVIGTREGHLIIIDVASGDIVSTEENAHDGAIWSLDVKHPPHGQRETSLVTGSADKLVKYWAVECHEGHPSMEHTRTLQMSDDVMCVRFSHSTDPSKRLLFVASLDSTIKVFFDDSLKFFLSLYGHKLPVLAFDSSSDDTILASGGADKSIKIWGLDFGDTHRSLHGHDDSITDLRFVKRTHNFFTCSKDKSVRYWDGDKFHQILLLRGHASEVNSLAVSSNGAFVLSGGMDRQVRIWERTKDIVFLDEEREREMEEIFDKVDGSRNEENTADALMKARKDGDDGLDVDDDDNEKPQSEAAVKQSILSVSSGDRIMEAIETADKESKEIASFRKLQEERGGDGKRAPNPMLFGMDPPYYVLWILRSVKSADLEQSLLVLPLSHVERLIHYLILNLQRHKGVELCAKVSVFLIKAHQKTIIANRTMMTPLRELQTLVRMRTSDIRDTVGFNLAAIRMICRISNEKKSERLNLEEKTMKDIWGELGKIG